MAEGIAYNKHIPETVLPVEVPRSAASRPLCDGKRGYRKFCGNTLSCLVISLALASPSYRKREDTAFISAAAGCGKSVV